MLPCVYWDLGTDPLVEHVHVFTDPLVGHVRVPMSSLPYLPTLYPCIDPSLCEPGAFLEKYGKPKSSPKTFECLKEHGL